MHDPEHVMIITYPIVDVITSRYAYVIIKMTREIFVNGVDNG